MSNYSIQAKSKIQKENPFRLFYEGFPTAYSMQNWNWNKKISFKKSKEMVLENKFSAYVTGFIQKISFLEQLENPHWPQRTLFIIILFDTSTN